MDKEKYLEVIKNITERAIIDHEHANDMSDTPCHGIEYCWTCRDIAGAQKFITEIESED